jgi:hypothetical protein
MLTVSNNQFSGLNNTLATAISVNGTYRTASIVNNSFYACTADYADSSTILGSKSFLGNGSSYAASQVKGMFVGNSENNSVDILDYYLEGTYTPTITIGGLSTGITYTTQTGKYTRIGNTVFFTARIVLSSKASLVGDVTLICLPKDATAATAVSVYCGGLNTTVGDTAISASTFSSGSGCGVYKMVGGYPIQLTNTDILNTAQFRIAGTYLI